MNKLSIENVRNKYGYGSSLNEQWQIDFSNQAIDGIERVSDSSNKFAFDDHKSSLVAINLSFNQFTSLKYEHFRNLSELIDIMLNNNKLVYLNENLFRHLSNLAYLQLAMNRLESLDSTIFARNANLCVLNLSFNKLKVIGDKLFANCVNLHMLRLDGNRIIFIHQNAFERLEKLNSLYLSYNRIETLDSHIFAKCTRLNCLFLDNNRLCQSIDRHMFAQNTQLVQLDLSNNLLSHVVDDAFVSNKDLVELGLFNNKFDFLSFNCIRPLVQSKLNCLWLDQTQVDQMKSNRMHDSRSVSCWKHLLSLVQIRDVKRQLVMKFELDDVDNDDDNEDEEELVEDDQSRDYYCANRVNKKIIASKSTELMEDRFSSLTVRDENDSMPSSLNNSFNFDQNRRLRNLRFSERSNYKMLDKIGNGTFSAVFLVQDQNDDNKLKAIKQIECDRIDSELSSTTSQIDFKSVALNEIEILKSINHVNIVKYYEWFWQDDSICIVLEYCQKKDLADLIQKQIELESHFSSRIVYEYARQIITAVEFLHSKLVIHRDVKPNNIFVQLNDNMNDNLKLGDLGNAKVIENLNSCHSLIGTLSYMSPELLQNKGYSFKTDIWSIGCVLYEIIKLKKLFSGTLEQIVMNIIRNDVVFDSSFDKEMEAILSCMLKKEPSQRVDSHELLKRYTALINFLRLK